MPADRPTTPTDCSATDSRSRLTRWWHRKTIKHGTIDGSLLVRVKVRLAWGDRLLIALGRDCEIECRTPSTDDAIIAAVDGVESSFTTIPRSWR